MELKGKWKVARVAGQRDESGNVTWLDEEQHKAQPGYSPADANPYSQYYYFEDNTVAYPLMPLPPGVSEEQVNSMLTWSGGKLVDGMIMGTRNPIELKEENGRLYCSLKVFGDPDAPWEEVTYEDGLLHFLVIYKLEKVE